MFSSIIGAYVVILVIETILFLLAWSQTRITSALVSSVLAVAAFLLLLTPDSTLANWIVRIFPGQSALRAASVLLPSSRSGSIFYGAVIVALALIAQPWRWGKRTADTAQQGKPKRHHK